MQNLVLFLGRANYGQRPRIVHCRSLHQRALLMSLTHGALESTLLNFAIHHQCPGSSRRCTAARFSTTKCEVMNKVKSVQAANLRGTGMSDGTDKAVVDQENETLDNSKPNGVVEKEGIVRLEEAEDDYAQPESEEQALALNADGLRYWLREVLRNLEWCPIMCSSSCFGVLCDQQTILHSASKSRSLKSFTSLHMPVRAFTFVHHCCLLPGSMYLASTYLQMHCAKGSQLY